MSLTDIKVRTAKSLDKPYKLSDSGGLFLLITPTGSKYWRLKYRFELKEKGSIGIPGSCQKNNCCLNFGEIKF